MEVQDSKLVFNLLTTEETRESDRRRNINLNQSEWKVLRRLPRIRSVGTFEVINRNESQILMAGGWTTEVFRKNKEPNSYERASKGNTETIFKTQYDSFKEKKERESGFVFLHFILIQADLYR